MTLQNSIKIALCLITAALLVLVALKPSINQEFHTRYINSLGEMESLSGSLIRNLLLARHGHVNHFDFIESDLQKMERYAQLVLFHPQHVGNDFLTTIKPLHDQYLVEIDHIRKDVELSKRGIGLLKNSNNAIELALHRLNAMGISDNDHPYPESTLTLLVGLNQAFREKNDFEGIRYLLNELQKVSSVHTQMIGQMQLHTSILEQFYAPIAEKSESLYQRLDALNQPTEIRNAYLAEHQSAQSTTTILLWMTLYI